MSPEFPQPRRDRPAGSGARPADGDARVTGAQPLAHVSRPRSSQAMGTRLADWLAPGSSSSPFAPGRRG